jgi:hypothetical protein
VAGQTPSYDAYDRLAGGGYDGEGSTTISGGNSYQYDVEDRLTNFNNGWATIVYNGGPRQVGHAADGLPASSHRHSNTA